jgi:uncharacterized phiE125 gp8 family phage protein
MRLSLITAPTAEPVDLAEVKAQCRVEEADSDALLTGQATAARIYAEGFMGRQLITATWELWLESFPCGSDRICVPLPPLQSVTSIKYIDTSGVLQTWGATYYLVVSEAATSPYAQKATIEPVYGTTWPVCREQPNAVQVKFVAGYGASSASVPEAIRRAILQGVSAQYDNRESPPMALAMNAALWPFRVW